MARELFNSPEKKWVREHFWLPSLLSFKARFPPDTRFRYLTFAGPEGRDIEFFTQEHRVFAIADIRVWEKSDGAASKLGQKFGPELQVKPGEAFTLSSAEKRYHSSPMRSLTLTSPMGSLMFERAAQNRISSR